MKASAMPVFPLVGSTSTVLPGVMVPFFSASSMRDRPRRSLTDEHGPRDSNLPSSRMPLETSTPWLTRMLLRSIRGVFPMSSLGRDAMLRSRVVVADLRRLCFVIVVDRRTTVETMWFIFNIA